MEAPTLRWSVPLDPDDFGVSRITFDSDIVAMESDGAVLRVTTASGRE